MTHKEISIIWIMYILIVHFFFYFINMVFSSFDCRPFRVGLLQYCSVVLSSSSITINWLWQIGFCLCKTINAATKVFLTEVVWLCETLKQMFREPQLIFWSLTWTPSKTQPKAADDDVIESTERLLSEHIHIHSNKHSYNTCLNVCVFVYIRGFCSTLFSYF